MSCFLTGSCGRITLLGLLAVMSTGSVLRPAPRTLAGESVSFTPSAASVEVYDFVEVTAQVKSPAAKNPFTDVQLTGQFKLEGAESISVEGFCDADNGTIFRTRFMPGKAGKYEYNVTYRHGDITETHTGTFEAKDGKRRGLVRVDKDHPWHFLWEGTGEHYFFNGTTAYLLLGWNDEAVIRACLDRFKRYKINRIRVLLSGRPSHSFWGEPIIPGNGFDVSLNSWPAQRPDDRSYPAFDYTRFRTSH